MPLATYYPEMGEPKPASQIEAQLSHDGRHWYVNTPLTLTGRGLTFCKRHDVGNLVPGSHRVGWNKYRATKRAFDTLTAKFAVSAESLL